ncbi:MAG: hypothetical protein WBC04_06335 [Candidatus Acidiferrales bacterium]
MRLAACSRLLSIHGGETIEKQLADVGESHRVAAADAIAGKLLEEIAEEEVDGGGGGEVVDPGEQLGGDGFVAGLGGRAASVMDAESGVAGGEQAAAVARALMCWQVCPSLRENPFSVPSAAKAALI